MGTALAGPAIGSLGLRLLSAALGAELAGDRCAAGALPAIRHRCGRNGRLIGLLRHTKAAHHIANHAHAHKSRHGAGRIARRGLQGVGHCGHAAAFVHSGIGAIGYGVLHLLDLLHILGVQGDGIQRDLLHTDSAVTPIGLQRSIHSVSQLICSGRQLGGAQLHLSQGAKGGLQGGDEFRFHLLVNLVSGKRLHHIAADFGIEQQRVADGVGVNAVAADVDGTAEAKTLVHDLEDDGAGGAELVAHDLLGIDVIHSLILAGVAAVGEALADGFEGLEDTVTQLARKNGRFCGSIICIFAGFGADFHDLALLHDEHTLTIGHSDAGAVTDDVLTALGIGGTAGNTFLSFHHQGIHIHSVAIKEFLPLIRQYAAQGAQTCFNKSHNHCSFHFLQ